MTNYDILQKMRHITENALKNRESHKRTAFAVKNYAAGMIKVCPMKIRSGFFMSALFAL